jgi:hypothetical protein
MNTTTTNTRRRPFARIIDTVTAFVAECNYANARLISPQDTPARF